MSEWLEERVARLLCADLRGDPDVIHDNGEVRWKAWLPAARAAIEKIDAALVAGIPGVMAEAPHEGERA